MFRVHHVLILLREVSDGLISRRTYVVKHYRTCTHRYGLGLFAIHVHTDMGRPFYLLVSIVELHVSLTEIMCCSLMLVSYILN
jgi:hypothetical protein